MKGQVRKLALDVINDAPWGTHLCQFFQTKEDLIDTLVPYFKAGLEDNEFCMWVTSEPLNVQDAKASLKKAVRNLDDYIENGQLEILDYSQWYTKSGKFDADEVLQGWMEKESQALKRGFDGLRLTGNTFWLENKDWTDFAQYEETVDNVIGNHRMLAICSYSLDKCGVSEVLDVMANHEFALIKRGGEWQCLESIGRKRAEQALGESEEYLRGILSSLHETMIVVFDREGTRTSMWASPELDERYGIRSSEMVGKSLMDTLPSHEAQERIAWIQRVFETGEPLREEHLAHLPRGDFWHDVSFSPMRGPSGEVSGVVRVARDITERKQAEEEKKKLEAQFQTAQKMEAIGTLAGGIAHDFNNILMGIQGNASLVLIDKTSTHPDYERLKNIEQGVLSGAELTKQLLGFAMGGRYVVKPTDLNELIKRTSSMFGRTKKEITIHRKYHKGIWPVEVDQGQIEQVLLNLYVNAWQAMPGGGELYLETENVTLNEDYVKPFNMEPGRYVEISLTDTGVGMDEATRQRIFEPFFTTKEMGRGTGLGLASVYGIIKNHGGIITVDSIKGEARPPRLSESDGGQGTTFTMYLPASEKEVIKEEELPQAIIKGTETVLLVDDEDMIIDVGEEILKELGYTVLLARGGKEAIELYKKNKDKIDIVILDMIMPGVGGGETYDRLKEINPRIRVLLSSGYSIDGQAAEILERGCNGFIQKPFSMEQLSRSIREILDGEHA